MKPDPGRFVLATALLGWTTLGSFAYGGDTQYWNEFIFEFDIDERLSAELALEQQFVDDISEFALYNVTLEPSYAIADGWALGPGFRYEREKDDGDWLTEYRYWLHLSSKQTLGEWTGKLKTKLEFRDLEDEDVWRVRAKLKVQRPVHIASTKIEPFLSEEPFYDFSADQLNQNRATVGITTEPAANTEFTVYYLKLSKKSGDDWSTTNVFGTEFVFKL